VIVGNGWALAVVGRLWAHAVFARVLHVGTLNVFVESTEEDDMLVRHRLEVSQVESAQRVVKRLLPKV
jgi:hypothetical protein